MRTIHRLIYLSLLFQFLYTTAYSANHYVDKNANGINNGTSWSNAWESFSAINWSLIGPGDFIYISGGTDSTIYYEMLTPQCQGSINNQITIIAGKYSPSPSGHSGRVIIDGGGQVRPNSIYFDDYGAGSPRYITVKGFELREATGGIEFNIDDTTPPFAVGIIIDSLYIYDWYDLAGIQVQGNTDGLIVQNCRIVTCLDCGDQTDCFHFNGTDSQHARKTIIRNCVILNKNQDPLAHNDAIQSVIADGFVIYNNIIVNDSVYSPEGGGLPFILGDVDYNYNQSIQNRNPVILYNNFCYMGGVWYPNGNMGPTMWTRYYSDEAHQPLTYIINNTVVTNGPRVGGMAQEYKMHLVINNINAMYCLPDGVLGENWRTGGTHGWQTNFSANSGWSTAMPMDSVRYNLFWKQDNVQTLFTGGWVYSTGGTGGISGWSDWLNHGGTGINADPLFVDDFGHEPDQSLLTGKISAGSPAIGAGENIQPYLDFFYDTWGIVLPATDRDGKYRDITNPSIGAYEYATGGGNNPPNFPSNPNPANGAINQSVSLTLTWSCSDPDGDPLTYDVYFGSNNNPPLASGNQSNTSFNPGQLNANTTYYWKIVAKDNQGATTSGPIWNFTTQTAVVNNPPNQPSNPNPVNGATGRPVNLTMTWTCTDPEGDPLTYDVYFGTNSNPPIASTNRTSASFTPAQLNNNTTYYWKIVAKDNQGHSTSGTVWNFTTEAGGGGDTLVKLPVQNVEGVIQEPEHTPLKTIDGKGVLSGDPDSRWAAEPMPEEIIFDLGLNRTVYKTKLSFYNWNAGRIYNYSVSISSDQNNWVNIVPQSISASNQEWTIDEFPAVNARYVRVHFINNNQSSWAGLWEGEIWGINATVNNPPNQPSNPNPVNGVTGRPINLTTTWTCTDPDGDPLTYDVYFGTNSNPPIAATNRTSASFTPGQLNNNTTYYWKIVAKDNQGHSTSGTVWNFKTIYLDTTPPKVTNITVTSAKNVTVNFSEKLEPTNAKNKNNYLISNNVIINSVSLLPDSSSVLIKTSIQQRNREYSITMTNIADKSGNYTDPNPNVVSYFLPRRGPGYMIIIPVNKVIANNFDLNFLPEKTVDGKGMESPDSRWQSSTIMPDTLIFDFGNESSLDSLRISFYEWQSNRIYKYSVNCSVDSMKWHSIIKNVWSEEDEWTEIEFDSTAARYVELILQESNENMMASIWEIEFYGQDKFFKINNESESPSSFMLSQNYPNPFNPSTTFKYSIAKQSSVLIRIYDLIGNEIETLVNEAKPVGTYELTWNANNLPSGVYFYQLQAGDFVETKKMILMK